MDLIKEQVKEVIENNKKGIITEMSLPRKKVKDKIENIFPQIIENWCLIHYVVLSGDKQDLINHWKSELMAHINNICSLQIKENDSFDSRKKLINQIIIEFEYTTPSTINWVILSKFYKENIDRSTEIYNNILLDFINNISVIVDILSRKNENEVITYIENL